MTKTRIPIFFASDDNYLPYLAVTLASIEKHAADENIYDIRVLTANMNDESREKLTSLELPHLNIQIVDLEDRMKGVRREIRETLRDYYTESIFYRIFIPHLFPSLKKAIYLDCDIVLQDDIAKLYSIDIGDNILGVVRDECIAPIPDFATYVDKVIGAPEGLYFNSGVLVINIGRFREEKIEAKLVHLLKTFNFPTVAPDQDYLNYLCRGKVHYFDYGWNKMPHRGTRFPKKDIHLIHFNMFEKPWHYNGVKYEECFWEIAERTPFIDWLRSELEDYTDADRIKDQAAAAKLIGATVEIFNEKCSFCDAIPDDYFNGVNL